MEAYCGYCMDGYRFRVEVPTTIYDPLVGIVSVYDPGSNSLVDIEKFKLKQMPRWDIPMQAITLDKSDERALDTATDRLLERLIEE